MERELLSPVGDFDTLKQAVHNGCDAVYLGGKRFGARKFASNFDNDEMIKAIKYCHLYGVKLYVTVNTVIYENEIDECLEYLKFLHTNGVDAVIMQDIGLITLTRKVLPNLDIHVSTQAHTHNIEQIKLLEELGVTRVVVAREVPLEEINKLDTKLEIEAFIHGALCICYSGQCLFSSMLLSRSGNRGECAGICRLPFDLLKDDKKVNTNGKYLLSPRELNTTNHIEELLNSNITSFKIEGRMKSPTTIGYITRLYRYLIDNYNNTGKAELSEEQIKKLMVLFNRQYTDGYLFNSTYDNLMNITSPNHVGVKIGEVLEVTAKKIKIKLYDELNQEDGIRFSKSGLGMITNFIYDKKDNLISGASDGDIVYLDNKIGLKEKDIVYKTVDNKLIKELENYYEKKIDIDVKANIFNNSFTLEISDGVNIVSKTLDIVEESTGSGTSKDRIIEQLSKLGNTPFKLNSIDINDVNNIFIPISKLNDIRRVVIDELINIRENSKKEVIVNDKIEVEKNNSSDKIKINVLVRNKEQLETCLKENIDNIYVVDEKLYKEYKNLNNIYFRLPRVMYNYNNYDSEKLLIGETGSINKYIKNNILVNDYYLNVVNSYYVNYLRNKGLERITLSTENKIEDIENIISKCGNNNIEVIVYGRLEAMVMKYDIINTLATDDNSKYCLKDRNGEVYPIIKENNVTKILYYKNLDLTNDMEKLVDIGIKNYRIELFDEDKFEVLRIIKNIKTF